MILEQHKVTWFLLHNICVVCLRPLKRLYTNFDDKTRVFRPLSSFGNNESLIKKDTPLKTIFSDNNNNKIRRSVRNGKRSSRAFHPTTDQNQTHKKKKLLFLDKKKKKWNPCVASKSTTWTKTLENQWTKIFIVTIMDPMLATIELSTQQQ